MRALPEDVAITFASYLNTLWHKARSQTKGKLIHAKYRNNHGTLYRISILTFSGSS